MLSSPIIVIVNPDCNRGGQVAAGGQRTVEGAGAVVSLMLYITFCSGASALVSNLMSVFI